MGLSFKPGTDDIREAPSLVLLERLLKEDFNIRAFDPIAIENAKKVFDSKIKYMKDIDNAVDDAQAIVIVTEWLDFKELRNKNIKGKIIIDGRNMFTLEEAKEMGILYYSVGRPLVGE